MWFYPPGNAPADIAELHFEYDPNNRWLCRIKDICAAAMKRWRGNVLVGMPDVGMGLDVLASFRTTEQLLLDLIDSPREVQRLMRELNTLWFRFYKEIDEVMQPLSPGYSDWAGIFCEKPFYTLQSDFSYMIGTPMFEEFTKPWIESQCKTLSHSIYHLDGVGQRRISTPCWPFRTRRHPVDTGGRKPDFKHWPEVYRNTRRGQNTVVRGLETLGAVIGQIGSPKNICTGANLGYVPDPAALSDKLREYGI